MGRWRCEGNGLGAGARRIMLQRPGQEVCDGTECMDNVLRGTAQRGAKESRRLVGSKAGSVVVICGVR
jgi:hypothetical protein